LEGDVLFAQTGRMDLAHAQELGLDVAWGLAQSSIGQAMEASPLQMTMTTAALATGKMAQPVLFKDWDGRRRRLPRPETLDATPREYALLLQGMKLVTETGTAREAFADHPDQCRVFGKTGTANVGQSHGRTQRRHHSAWFVGWREPEARGERRLAFGCMVSHVHGRRATGGSVCAPIVAEMLRGM
jgi:cell division protein FtsI/penicillin-binding protein 2